MKRLVLWGLAAILAVYLLANSVGQRGLHVGSKAPDFSVEPLDQPGKLVSLKDLRGKVVLVDFWATWCGPCRYFSPTIQSLYRKYSDKGLVILSISGEPRPVIEQFAKEEKPIQKLYVDVSLSAWAAYKVEPIPVLYVVDRQGNIAYGKGEADARAIEAAIVKSL